MTALVAPSAYILYPPDWSQDITLRRIWKTSILTSIVGDEQRTSLRTLVKHSLSMTICTMDETETGILRREIHYAQHTIWGIPVWPLEMKLASGVSAGASSLTVDDATGCEVSSFGKILIGGKNNYDICTVGSVAGNTVSLSGELVTKSWAANQKLYPIMVCDLSDLLEFTQPTPYHYQATFDFVESDIVST